MPLKVRTVICVERARTLADTLGRDWVVGKILHIPLSYHIYHILTTFIKIGCGDDEKPS